MQKKCVKCKWNFLCGSGEKTNCTFEHKSEYKQIDNMTLKEKEIERKWLENIVKEMLE